MIKKYNQFLLLENNESEEFIPLDIRKKYDSGFENGKYKGKNIDHFYDIMAERNFDMLIDLYRNNSKSEYRGLYKTSRKPELINMFLGVEGPYGYHLFFEKNEQYLEYMRKLLIGKRVGYYNYGDKNEDNYYYVLPIVRGVDYNAWGLLIVAGGGGGGSIDERMPLKIIGSKSISSEADPFGEESWYDEK